MSTSRLGLMAFSSRDEIESNRTVVKIWKERPISKKLVINSDDHYNFSAKVGHVRIITDMQRDYSIWSFELLSKEEKTIYSISHIYNKFLLSIAGEPDISSKGIRSNPGMDTLFGSPDVTVCFYHIPGIPEKIFNLSSVCRVNSPIPYCAELLNDSHIFYCAENSKVKCPRITWDLIRPQTDTKVDEDALLSEANYDDLIRKLFELKRKELKHHPETQGELYRYENETVLPAVSTSCCVIL